jgi:hypothetical protein
MGKCENYDIVEDRENAIELILRDIDAQDANNPQPSYQELASKNALLLDQVSKMDATIEHLKASLKDITARFDSMVYHLSFMAAEQKRDREKFIQYLERGQ